jgi:choice-of-anchor A domain-containing protein
MPRLGRCLVALAIGSSVAMTGAVLTAAPTAAAEGDCPPGWEPVGPGPGDGFDSNVSIFSGGNFSVSGGAAEAEGLLVVGGDATFARTTPGTYNVGVVGVGSGISPPPGSDMLLVGGDISGNANTTIDVGHAIGGAVRLGGTVAAGTDLQTSGGVVTENDPTATSAYDGFPTLLQQKSTSYAALATTGTVNVTGFSVTLTGDGTSGTQVLEIPAASLGDGSVTRSLQFLGIPTDAAVIINVTGATAGLFFNALLTTGGAVMDPFTDPDFPRIATHTLWNFPDATDVTIGGLAQLPGSILVPSAASTTTISSPGTNGRVYVNGDLVHTGDGAEMHNYPFLPEDDFTCKPIPTPTGSLAVQKVVEDPDGVVPPAWLYSGTFACELHGTDVTPSPGTWSVLAGQPPTVIADTLPLGADCTLAESPPPDLPPGHHWDPVVITPSVVTITDSVEPAAFTATNTAAADPTGSLAVDKVVVDPGGVVPTDRVYSGTFACTPGGTGTWSVTAAEPAKVIADPLPVGAVCTLAESPPADLPPGHHWDPVVITPSSVTITSGLTPATFTVTNTAAADPPSEETGSPGGGSNVGALPDTGAPDGLTAEAIAGVLLVALGIALLTGTRIGASWEPTASHRRSHRAS